MLSLDELLRHLRRGYVIPSECESFFPDSKGRILIGLSDTETRTLGDFLKYYDLNDFKTNLHDSKLEARCSYLFVDFSWSYLTFSEQKKFLVTTDPVAVAISIPEAPRSFDVHILKMDNLGSVLAIARHELNGNLYLRYSGYTYPEMFENPDWCRNVKLIDVKGLQFFPRMGYTSNLISVDATLGTVDCFVYTKEESSCA